MAHKKKARVWSIQLTMKLGSEGVLKQCSVNLDADVRTVLRGMSEAKGEIIRVVTEAHDSILASAAEEMSKRLPPRKVRKVQP